MSNIHLAFDGQHWVRTVELKPASNDDDECGSIEAEHVNSTDMDSSSSSTFEDDTLPVVYPSYANYKKSQNRRGSMSDGESSNNKSARSHEMHGKPPSGSSKEGHQSAPPRIPNRNHNGRHKYENLHRFDWMKQQSSHRMSLDGRKGGGTGPSSVTAGEIGGSLGTYCPHRPIGTPHHASPRVVRFNKHKSESSLLSKSFDSGAVIYSHQKLPTAASQKSSDEICADSIDTILLRRRRILSQSSSSGDLIRMKELQQNDINRRKSDHHIYTTSNELIEIEQLIQPSMMDGNYNRYPSVEESYMRNNLNKFDPRGSPFFKRFPAPKKSIDELPPATFSSSPQLRLQDPSSSPRIKRFSQSKPSSDPSILTLSLDYAPTAHKKPFTRKLRHNVSEPIHVKGNDKQTGEDDSSVVSEVSEVEELDYEKLLPRVPTPPISNSNFMSKAIRYFIPRANSRLKRQPKTSLKKLDNIPSMQQQQSSPPSSKRRHSLSLPFNKKSHAASVA